jgi:hypothetical protein
LVQGSVSHVYVPLSQLSVADLWSIVPLLVGHTLILTIAALTQSGLVAALETKRVEGVRATVAAVVDDGPGVVFAGEPEVPGKPMAASVVLVGVAAAGTGAAVGAAVVVASLAAAGIP